MTAARQFHEGKAIDAVLRRIEAREGAARADDGRSPEEEGHRWPVDYARSVGGRLLAIEHTGIEPFAGAIKLEIDNERLFAPIRARFDGGAPVTEFWELIVPVEATAGLVPSDFWRAQQALGAWIEANAGAVLLARYGDRYGNSPLGESADQVPFRFSLHRWRTGGGPLGGRFVLKFVAPHNLEDARHERLQKACEDKFEKLAGYKSDTGARSILILEENDISLTNHQVVFEALTRAEAGRKDMPDEVYLVSTCLQDVWWVTRLRADDRGRYYDDEERFWEVDSASLISLTRR